LAITDCVLSSSTIGSKDTKVPVSQLSNGCEEISSSTVSEIHPQKIITEIKMGTIIWTLYFIISRYAIACDT
jgi:hypothetical protein